MKKILLSLLIFSLFVSVSFSNEKKIELTQQNISFGNYTDNLSSRLNEKVDFYAADFSKLAPHKNKFLAAAIALTAVSGVFFTSAIVTAGVAGGLFAGGYQYSVFFIPVVAVSATCWGIFAALLAPICAVMWVCYVLAMIHGGNQSQNNIKFHPSKDQFAICISLGRHR